MDDKPPAAVIWAATIGPYVPVIVFATLAALNGCASQPAKLPPPAPVATCLPLKRYDADQQKALASSLASLPPETPVAQAMVDYLAMRDADRACLSSK